MKKIETLADFLGLDPEGHALPVNEQFAEMSIKDFCRGVLKSPEYRRSVYLRVCAGALPPAVELRLYDYAEGKPVEHHEHTGKDGAPIEHVTEVRSVIVRSQEDYAAVIDANKSERQQPPSTVH